MLFTEHTSLSSKTVIWKPERKREMEGGKEVGKKEGRKRRERKGGRKKRKNERVDAIL